MGNENKKSNAERLTNILGADPGKGNKITKEVFSKALEKVQTKRSDAAEEEAMKYLEEAITIREEQGKLERQFNGQMAGIEKKLGKAINKIQAFANGQPPPKEDDAGNSEGEAAAE